MNGDESQRQPLWNPSESNVQGRLRAPKINVNSTPIQNNQATCPPAPKTTTLRAEAPEFVPTWLKSGTSNLEQQFQNVHITVSDGVPLQKHSAQNRFQKIKKSSQNMGGDFVAQNNEQSSSCYYPAHPSIPNGENNSTDMMRLKQLINSLIKYPGQFDDLLMVFMETIYPYFQDILAMSEIAQLLVNQAINAPNFRYNGARLCWYVEQKCPEFRAELHLKCKKELQENPHLQNVVLFIAELYTQLPHDSLYGSLLIDSLKKLLIIGGADNIKCVCQGLKLTGYSLESNHKPALDELFSQLRDFTNTLTGSALLVLHSVINLRESNWGRELESSNSPSDLSDYDQDYEEMVNGILYEVDGQTLTNEEQEFLAANMGQDEYILDNEDPDALCDPEPEMDEEIQAAFVEFVKKSKG